MLVTSTVPDCCELICAHLQAGFFTDLSDRLRRRFRSHLPSPPAMSSGLRLPFRGRAVSFRPEKQPPERLPSAWRTHLLGEHHLDFRRSYGHVPGHDL